MIKIDLSAHTFICYVRYIWVQKSQYYVCVCVLRWLLFLFCVTVWFFRFNSVETGEWFAKNVDIDIFVVIVLLQYAIMSWPDNRNLFRCNFFLLFLVVFFRQFSALYNNFVLIFFRLVSFSINSIWLRFYGFFSCVDKCSAYTIRSLPLVLSMIYVQYDSQQSTSLSICERLNSWIFLVALSNADAWIFSIIFWACDEIL